MAASIKFCIHGLWLNDCATCNLAKLVADMPEPLKDDKSVKEWAEKLAADISKFND